MGKETEGEATTTCAQSHHHDSLHLISNRKHKSLKYYVFLITEAQCCVHGIFKRKADVDCLNISKVILHINLFMRRFSLPSICSTLWFLPSPHTQSDLLSSPIKSAHLRWKTFSRTGDPRAALRSDRKTGNCWRCLCTVYRSGALKMHEVSSESVGKKKKEFPNVFHGPAIFEKHISTSGDKTARAECVFGVDLRHSNLHTSERERALWRNMTRIAHLN